MLLTPMRYKDYIWPHNPTTYSITYERQVALHKVPFGRYYMQDLGQSCRVMRGEGVFYGEGAYDEFKKLATVFYGGGPGLLIHPVWQISNASLHPCGWSRNRCPTTSATALPSMRATTNMRTHSPLPGPPLPSQVPPRRSRSPARLPAAISCGGSLWTMALRWRVCWRPTPALKTRISFRWVIRW